MDGCSGPVLVTGGAGFIGSWTVESLCARGYEVVVLDNLSSGSLANLSSVWGRIVFVEGDVRDSSLASELFRRFRFCGVVHFAAVTSVEEVYRDPVQGFRVNVEGTFNLLEASRRFDVERFVYASSAAVYGDPVELPVREDHPLNPKSLYGATKLAGEILAEAYTRSYGLSTVSLRYFNIYGPRMKTGPYAGVVYRFIEESLRGEPLTIHGDGLQTRDFLYVEDAAEATVKALESRATGPLNIGSGSSITVKDLAYMIARLTGREGVEVVHVEPRPGDIRHSRADNRKAVMTLGWKPRTPLEEGLKKTIEYYKARQTVYRQASPSNT